MDLPRLRFTMRQMLATVAIVGVMLAIYVPTVRMRVDWSKPETNEIVITGWLLLAETVMFYYVGLFVWALSSPERRRIRPAKFRWALLLLPGLLAIAYALILEVLDNIQNGQAR
jgi:hypothetical protein